jgi:hypothetical protein
MNQYPFLPLPRSRQDSYDMEEIKVRSEREILPPTNMWPHADEFTFISHR